MLCQFLLYSIVTHTHTYIHTYTLFFFFLPFLGPLLWHIEVPRLGVQSELLSLAYARATAKWDPRCIFDLQHSSQQHQILNPLSKVRDQTRNLMVPSQIC